MYENMYGNKIDMYGPVWKPGRKHEIEELAAGFLAPESVWHGRPVFIICENDRWCLFETIRILSLLHPTKLPQSATTPPRTSRNYHQTYPTTSIESSDLKWSPKPGNTFFQPAAGFCPRCLRSGVRGADLMGRPWDFWEDPWVMVLKWLVVPEYDVCFKPQKYHLVREMISFVCVGYCGLWGDWLIHSGLRRFDSGCWCFWMDGEGLFWSQMVSSGRCIYWQLWMAFCLWCSSVCLWCSCRDWGFTCWNLWFSLKLLDGAINLKMTWTWVKAYSVASGKTSTF